MCWQNFLPKLKEHLLPCVLSDLRDRRKIKASFVGDSQLEQADDFDDSVCKPESILFKHDRLYRHNMIRINYTTYDVRRGQDTIHPKTSHCNIMTLKNHDMD